MQIKKNTSLVFALLIPIIMVALVAVSIYLPGVTTKPAYNFLYSVGDKLYSIKNNQLLRENHSSAQAKLFVYDIKKNVSKEISFQDAKKLILIDGAIAPDGFEVLRGGDAGEPFLFWDGSGSAYKDVYVKGRFFGKKINVRFPQDSNAYFHFIAWIKN